MINKLFENLLIKYFLIYIAIIYVGLPLLFEQLKSLTGVNYINNLFSKINHLYNFLITNNPTVKEYVDYASTKIKVDEQFSITNDLLEIKNELNNLKKINLKNQKMDETHYLTDQLEWSFLLKIAFGVSMFIIVIYLSKYIIDALTVNNVKLYQDQVSRLQSLYVNLKNELDNNKKDILDNYNQQAVYLDQKLDLLFSNLNTNIDKRLSAGENLSVILNDNISNLNDNLKLLVTALSNENNRQNVELQRLLEKSLTEISKIDEYLKNGNIVQNFQISDLSSENSNHVISDISNELPEPPELFYSEEPALESLLLKEIVNIKQDDLNKSPQTDNFNNEMKVDVDINDQEIKEELINLASVNINPGISGGCTTNNETLKQTFNKDDPEFLMTFVQNNNNVMHNLVIDDSIHSDKQMNQEVVDAIQLKEIKKIEKPESATGWEVPNIQNNLVSANNFKYSQTNTPVFNIIDDRLFSAQITSDESFLNKSFKTFCNGLNWLIFSESTWSIVVRRAILPFIPSYLPNIIPQRLLTYLPFHREETYLEKVQRFFSDFLKS